MTGPAKQKLKPLYLRFLEGRRALRRRRVRLWRAWVPDRIKRAHRLLTVPHTILFLLLYNPRIHPGYGLTRRRKIALGVRMYRNTRKVQTATSYKAHLAMAAKLLEVPPEVEGDVVECGCYLGGSTANLSLVCEIVDRRLIVYDSFAGLPEPTPGDKYATDETAGYLRAGLDQVKGNVARLGRVDRCEFRKGWFEETLPQHDSPIVFCFLDVDYQASLRDCVLNLWPHLTEQGFVFIDEYVLVDYCALFFSEKFWDRYFGRKPPGLIGAGTGVGVGEYYLGPRDDPVTIQGPASVAYTRKDFSGVWEYFPEDAEDESNQARMGR